MSTANTRVLRNVTNCLVVSTASNVNATVASIMEIRLTDRTGTLRTGSDNDAAFRHFAGNYECDIEIVAEDPKQLSPINGANNATVTFVAVDLTGNGNVNVNVSSVAFRQASLPDARYSDQARSSIGGTGGAIVFS